MGDGSRLNIFIKIGATDYNSSDYTIPAERTFREAWEPSGEAGVIAVNMTKAKDLWRDKIREARIEPFQALDTAYMKALETGADTSSIVAEKQALRDAPALASIENATTPEELKSIQPIPNVTIE